MTSRAVEIVTRFIRETRQREKLPRPSPNARADAIEAIEGALHARARRKKLMACAGVAAAIAIAAGIALLVGTFLTRRSRADESPLALAPAANMPDAALSGLALKDGLLLEAGTRIVAQPSHPTILSLSSGTVLTVKNGGDVTLVEASATQKLMLTNGMLEAHVAKLHQGERFIITTPDAEVEVRGTAFDVSIVDPDPSCGGGTRTRVNVREGVVSVRDAHHDVRVRAGDSWPAGCDAYVRAVENAPHSDASRMREIAPTTPSLNRTATAAVASSTLAPSLNTASTTTNAASGIAPSVDTASTVTNAPLGIASVSLGVPTPPVAHDDSAHHSTLAEQNDAFRHAVLLRQHGNNLASAKELELFIASYPSSPLIESVHVEEIRALRTIDSARAARLAREYLAAYPSGFARAEAESIAAQ